MEGNGTENDFKWGIEEQVRFIVTGMHYSHSPPVDTTTFEKWKADMEGKGYALDWHSHILTREFYEEFRRIEIPWRREEERYQKSKEAEKKEPRVQKLVAGLLENIADDLEPFLKEKPILKRQRGAFSHPVSYLTVTLNQRCLGIPLPFCYEEAPICGVIEPNNAEFYWQFLSELPKRYFDTFINLKNIKRKCSNLSLAIYHLSTRDEEQYSGPIEVVKSHFERFARERGIAKDEVRLRPGFLTFGLSL